MNPGLTSLLLLGLFVEHGPPPRKQANCIWLPTWMKASHFWMSRQATGRSVIQWRQYMRVSARADAISWHTSQMEVSLLVSRCSVFVSTYSGWWLRHLARFSCEVTAPCSPFPPYPCSSVGGARSRAGVAEMSHCTLNQCKWIHWNLCTGCGGVSSGSSAPDTCPPGLDSHSLYFHQMLLNAMSMYGKVWEGEEEKYPCCTILLPFHKMHPSTNMKHNLPLMDFLLLWKACWRKIFCVFIWLCICAFTAYICHHF